MDDHDLKDALKRALIEHADPPVALPGLRKLKRATTALLITAAVLAVLAGYLVFVRFPSITTTTSAVAANPSGAFTDPKPYATVKRTFHVTGETRNLPPDTKVILVVDVERLRLCWPKKPFIEPNSRFRVSITEEGPVGRFMLSMYAVDRKYADLIEQWFGGGTLGGMAMLPKRYLLQSKYYNVAQE